MKKNLFLIGMLMLVVFCLFLSTNFISAQTFNIPKPECVRDIAEIPCPDDENIDLSKIQKAQSLSIPTTGESKTFSNFLKTLSDRLKPLSKDIDKFADQIIGQFEIFFNKFLDFFVEKEKI